MRQMIEVSDEQEVLVELARGQELVNRGRGWWLGAPRRPHQQHVTRKVSDACVAALEAGRRITITMPGTSAKAVLVGAEGAHESMLAAGGSKAGQLEETTWAREFRADSPASYAEALALAARPGLVVEIERAASTLGEACFAIFVADRSLAFWMDHKPTRAAAEALCKEMGWHVRR